MSGEAFDLDDLAFTAEFVGQPLSGGLRPGFLIDTDIVYARDIQFLVHGDHDDALVQRFEQGGIQTIDITGVDQDGIHILGHQVLQLLDLASHIRIGAFDHEFVGDALVHVFFVDFHELIDHLSAVFAADERIGNTDREFLGVTGVLNKILLYFFIGQDLVQQVGIRFAFAHLHAIGEVFLGDDGRNGQNEG